MIVVLDSGGVTALATDSEHVKTLREHGHWPPVVPTAVLVECLTGDHRRDFHTNRLLHVCVVKPVTEILARHAASLRSAASRKVSAVDAIVAAFADQARGGVVVTSDPDDLNALAANTINRVRVAPV